jgi:hypothetical protein
MGAPGVLSDGGGTRTVMTEPCRALPRKCLLFIYSFIEDSANYWEGVVGAKLSNPQSCETLTYRDELVVRVAIPYSNATFGLVRKRGISCTWKTHHGLGGGAMVGCAYLALPRVRFPQTGLAFHMAT